MSQGCALLILRSKGQRSRSWRMVIWKWFPDDNWLCNQPMIMKLHTLTHHESRMRPIDFEVKRSRSWRMVIWKWFPDDNWLCNQPMIMKLHTLTPHESRMCPIDFGVKRSTVKVMAHGYLKMVHRNNGCRFEFVGVGGGPVLLQQYFQYSFICCPYMLPLLFFRVPTVLEKSLNVGFSLKSPWKWICPWKVLEFRGTFLELSIGSPWFLVLCILNLMFEWIQQIKRYKSQFFPKKIWHASLAAAYKLNIFPVPLADI